MTRPLRMGLIGFGWIAEIAHVPTIQSSTALELVAAVEPNRERASRLADRVPQVRIHESLEGLLQDAAVEAVLIATPTRSHAAHACSAFEAGKHVYLEKPLAMDSAQGADVVRSWQEGGMTGAVGFNFRRNPIVQDAARRVADEELGSLVAISGSFHWAAERVGGWRASAAEGGGVLLDLISHQVDLVAAITGHRLSEVQCRLQSIRTEEDAAIVSGATTTGTLVQLSASYVSAAQINRFELIGTRGALVVNLLDGRPSLVERPPGRGARVCRGLRALRDLHPIQLLRSPGWEPSFRATLLAFADAVVRGAPFAPSPEDGLDVLTVLDAAKASERAGGTSMQVRRGPFGESGPP